MRTLRALAVADARIEPADVLGVLDLGGVDLGAGNTVGEHGLLLGGDRPSLLAGEGHRREFDRAFRLRLLGETRLRGGHREDQAGRNSGGKARAATHRNTP
jgi:hypothetical protein